MLKRSDFRTKFGGDLTLINLFKEIFLTMDCHVVETIDPFCDLTGFDCVFAVNIDRTFENYILLRRCLEGKVAFLLYTLHHPSKGMNAYVNSRHLFGFRRWIAILSGRNFLSYKTLLSHADFVLKGKFRKLPYIKGLHAFYGMKFLVRNSTRVLVSTTVEKQHMENDFDLAIKNAHVVPHCFQMSRSALPHSKKSGLVLCAGRIEPRKNQMQILEVADQLKEYHFIFAGAASPTAPAYCQQFFARADKLENVSTVDFLPLDELRSLLRKAEIFVSASYSEVVSLIELEAYSQYCKMVLSQYSYIQEHIGPDSVVFVDPDSPGGIGQGIVGLSRQAINVDKRRYFLNAPGFKALSEVSVANALKSAVQGVL